MRMGPAGMGNIFTMVSNKSVAHRGMLPSFTRVTLYFVQLLTILNQHSSGIVNLHCRITLISDTEAFTSTHAQTTGYNIHIPSPSTFSISFNGLVRIDIISMSCLSATSLRRD